MAEIPIGLGTNNDGTPVTITQEISGKTQSYAFFYDTTSKKGNLFPIDDKGAKIAGGASIWTDGNWQATEIKDPNLTNDLQNTYNTILKTQLKTQLQNSNNASAVPQWALSPTQGSAPGQTSPSSPASNTGQPASPPSTPGNWWDNVPGNQLIPDDVKNAVGAFISAVTDLSYLLKLRPSLYVALQSNLILLPNAVSLVRGVILKQTC